jgi:hypothetical protein
MKGSTMRVHFWTLIVRIGISSLCWAQQSPADQDPAENGKEQERMDARILLEKGRMSGSLPGGMVIRISACLGAKDKSAPGDVELKEIWEFTSTQVHRVVREYEKDKGTYYYNRVESHPFDAKGICKDLLEGKAVEIQARRGEGPEVGFVGSGYHRGSRSIEVVWNGTTLLDLHETNGAGLLLYRESDARAFGALYARLAGQVRGLFKSSDAEEK